MEQHATSMEQHVASMEQQVASQKETIEEQASTILRLEAQLKTQATSIEATRKLVQAMDERFPSK